VKASAMRSEDVKIVPEQGILRLYGDVLFQKGAPAVAPGSPSNQSVLLMRLGDLIIAEWSHNGAIRFWKSTDKHAPQFHLPEYVGSQLRDGSMKIKVGNTQRDSIIHHENGDWMKWAAGAIKYFTNVTM
jgi:hypothetical protein